MSKAQDVWESFCKELVVEPTQDIKEAFATGLRKIANDHQYYHFGEGEDMVVDARILYDIAEDLDNS
jgi:hypothetical protein